MDTITEKKATNIEYQIAQKPIRQVYPGKVLDISDRYYKYILLKRIMDLTIALILIPGWNIFYPKTNGFEW